MKKAVSITLFACLILVSCIKNNVEKNDELPKDFQLDLTDLNIDFTKPQTLKYDSTLKRDSILNQLAEELIENVQDSTAKTDDTLNKILISVNEVPKTIVVQMQKETDVSFSDWNDLGLYNDSKSLNEKFTSSIGNSQMVNFGIECISDKKSVKLFVKK